MAALKQIGDGKFDIVFLDDLMPELNGLETLVAIKRRFPNTRVVFMMSTNDETFGARARTAGAQATLKKPFYPCRRRCGAAQLFRFSGAGPGAINDYARWLPGNEVIERMLLYCASE